MEKAFAYLRVSDVSQVKGDGFTRQLKTITDYAQRNNLVIAETFKESISGTEEDRPVLASLIVTLEKNHHGVKTVIIEKLDRLARDLMVQEAIIRDFKRHGFSLISALEGPDLCSNEPTRKLIRQLFGAIAEYDKSMTQLKLRAARDRMRLKTGKCEGRKGYKDTEEGQSLIRHIKALHRTPKYGKRKTLQQIADILNEEGFVTIDGNRWSVQRVFQVIKS
jgi:DNA invertase Pin-like site-specific DNA recombinase